MANQPTVNGLSIDPKGFDALRRSAQDKSPEALKAASKQFEALFLNMVMKSMREATPQDGMMDNDQTKMYTAMLDQQLSQSMSNRGVGLADMLVKQLSRSMGNQNLPTDTGQDATTGAVNNQTQVARSKKNPWASSAVPSSASSAATATDGTTASGKSGSKAAHVQAFQDRLASAAEEASQTTGIPAKFMLGQAALESGWGKHEIRGTDGTQSHNLFGVKATAGWKGKTVDAVTTEYVNGVPQKRVEKFRAYDSYADAFRDYASLLKSNPRYQNVLANAKDANSFAYGLQRAGYATDPNYGMKLAAIINKNLSA
jgi:flagellar protein FlgJ